MLNLGQMFTRKDIDIGDVIYVRVSTDDPSERIEAKIE